MNTLKFSTLSNTSILFLFVLLLLASCGKEPEGVFGEYQLTEYELTTCRLLANNQLGKLSDNNVCLTFIEDNSQLCVNNEILLSSDSTFVFTYVTEDYFENGELEEKDEGSINGIFSQNGTEILLLRDNKLFREYDIQSDGSLLRTTFSLQSCDIRKLFKKI